MPSDREHLATYATLRTAALHAVPGGRVIGSAQTAQVFEGRAAAFGWVELFKRGRRIGCVLASALVLTQAPTLARLSPTRSMRERIDALERQVEALTQRIVALEIAARPAADTD